MFERLIRSQSVDVISKINAFVKHKAIEIPVQIHVICEASRVRKDGKYRQREVEKAQASLDKPGQLKTSLK